MKAIEQYFPMVLFIILYNLVLTIESVDEILKCDHSNESCCAVLSCSAVYYDDKVILIFEFVEKIVKYANQLKLLSSSFLWCCDWASQGGSNL